MSNVQISFHRPEPIKLRIYEREEGSPGFVTLATAAGDTGMSIFFTDLNAASDWLAHAIDLVAGALDQQADDAVLAVPV